MLTLHTHTHTASDLSGWKLYFRCDVCSSYNWTCEHKMGNLTWVMEVRNGLLFVFSHCGWEDTHANPRLSLHAPVEERGGQNQKQQQQTQNSSYYKLNHCWSFISCRDVVAGHHESHLLTMIATSWLLSYYNPSVSSAVKKNRVERFTRRIKRLRLYL